MTIPRALTKLCGSVPSRGQAIGLIVLATAIARPSAAPPPMTGRVEGFVTLTSKSTRQVPSGVYPNRRVTAPAAQSGSEMANVVVYIKDAPARNTVPTTRATISQKDEAFVPRVVAITTGSSVEFPNFDPYFHNVFSLSRGGQLRSRPLPARRLPRPEVHERGINKGVLPDPLAHDGEHHGLRPRLLPDSGRRRLVHPR